MEKQSIIFFDKIGRLILGEVLSETEKNIVVKNPCVFQIQSVPNNGVNISLLPTVLFEQLNVHETKYYNLSYNKDNIEILVDDEGKYIKPAKNFLDIREKIFTKLSDGSFEKLIESKNAAMSATASQPEIIEIKK